MAILHIGTVHSVVGGKVYVSMSDIGAGLPIGPVETPGWIVEPGDRVVLGQIGKIPENLMMISVIDLPSDRTGTVWYVGDADPDDEVGKEGDFYLNTETYDLYRFVADAWDLLANIQGTTWFSGVGVPDDLDGNDGDFYLEEVTFDVYQKELGVWVLKFNFGGGPTDWTDLTGIPVLISDIDELSPNDAFNYLAPDQTGENGKFLTTDGTDTSWGTIGGGGDALTSQPLSQFAATTSAELAGVISDETGTGALVFANSPALVTPTGITKSDVGLSNVTNNAQYFPGGSDVAIADGGTGTSSANAGFNALAPNQTGNSGKFLTTDGSDTSWDTLPGGGDALTTDPLSQFAATTSAELAGVITNETGTGNLVFSNSPALVTPTGIVKGDVGLGNVPNVDATARANHTGTQLLATISDVTASVAEVNVLDGVTSSTAELNILDGVTTSTAELNFVDGVTSAIQTQLDAKQTTDADLTAIAGLSPSNDDVIQRKAGAWTNRTMAQIKTDLVLVKGDVGLGNVDNTSDATKNSASVALTNKTINGSSNTITNVSLTAGVTGILPGANGGTNNGFMDFTGPASTLKTFTLPNASSTILTSNAAVTVAQGGTGRTSAVTAYGIIAAGTTAGGTQQTIGTGVSGQILKSNGIAALATFQTGAPGDVGLGNVTNNAQYYPGGTDVAITDGGTGASTANAGFNALAPSQTGNSGEFLTTDGTNTSWAPIAGGGDALTTDPLSQFAATTSAELAGVITNETGSGALVFGTSPNITTPTGIVKSDVGLGNVPNVDATARASHTGTQLLATISDVTASAAEVNLLDGVTSSTTELNFVDGVTSAIQTQIDAKANDTDVVHDTGAETIAGVKTFSSDPLIPDEVYGVGWNGVLEPPTKNAVYDKIESLSVGGVTDGDKGDITVSGTGTVWTIDNDVVTYAKMQNVSATDRILGRDTAGAGDVEEISPANLRTMINVADGASANDTDANLKNRANHTGTQALATISDVTASAAEVNLLDGVTATTTEINYIDGVTSAIQGQIDAKVAGPGSATDKAIVRYSGTTGKLVQNGTPTVADDGRIRNVTNPSAAQDAVTLDYHDTAMATKQPLDSDLTTIAGLTATTDSFLQAKSSAWAARTIAQVQTDLVIPADTITALAGKQPLDSDLTTIAGLTATTDNFMVAVASAWASVTPSTAKTALALVKGDVGLGNVDNTSDATKNAAAVTLTNKTLTSPVINTPTGIVKGDVGLGNVDNTSNATERAATRTLTNARITKRSLQSSNDTTFDIDTDLYDYAEDIGLTGGVTVTWSGTPTPGQTLWVALQGTASRAITWDTDFEASTVPLPTTTAFTQRLDVGFVLNPATSKFRCVAVA